MDREDEKEFVALANEIIQKCNLNIKVDKLTDCNDAFFVLLYKGLIGDNLKGLIAYPVYRDEHIHNCKCVIESLANEVLNVDLSHIKANGIVDGDFMSITNLLEIFSGLLEYFMECIDENQSDSEDDLDDSNIITSQHQVISSLLKEEFGTSHQGDSKPEKSTQSTTKQTSSSEKPMSFLYSSANQITSGLQITEQPSMRFSSTFGLSGHEADSSEVSDSTNELIRLGESSGSGHSSTRITGPVRSAWKPSISDTINQQELTQYTISSDEGDSFQSHLNNKNKSSDHLSSSVISSTSSYRQQISPLDADHGIKLDSIGLRPKVDNITAPGKDSSEDGSSSGRSTPILHHHYHHHYHHPPELNTSRTGNMSSQYDNIQDYRTIPGNIKNAIQVGSTHHARAILLGSDVDGISKVTGYIPGQSASEGLAGRPRGISDYTSSVAGLSGNGIAKYTRDTVSGVPGQGIDNNGIGLAGESLSTGPSTGLPDYKAASVSGLQGKERSNLPFTEYSRVGMQGQSVSTGLSTGLPDYKTMSVPGLSGKERSNIPLTDYSGLIRQTQPSSLSISLADYKSTTRFSPPEKDHGHTAIETGPGYSRSVSGTTSLNSTRYLMQQNHSVSRPSELNTTGQSTSIHSSTIPEQRIPGSKFLSDHSRLRTSGHGELRAVSGVASSIPVTHSTSQSGLAGSLHDTSLASVPGSSSLRDQYLSRVLPLTTTTSLPSSSGLLTVSSGGYSDVFTNTDRMPGMPSNKSMDPKKIRDQQEPHQRTISQNTNLISTATGKDNKQTGPSKDDTKPEDVRHDNDDESDGDSDDDDDDDDDARYSDSAVDYHRGGAQVDSDNESGESSVLQRIHDRWQKLKSGQPSKPSARRAVTFNEDIETIPITSRMERLRRLLEEEADEQRQHTEAIRDVYAEQLQELQKQQHQERKDMGKRKVQKSPLVSKKKAKKPVPSKQRGRLEAIYRPQGRVRRPSKRPLAKARKRSASASPVVRRRKKTSIADCQESLLPSLFDEFPFLHVSPQTTHAMWQKQAKQISLLSKSETTALKSKSQRRVEEAEKRQERLLKILRKELEYNQRVRNEQERQDHQRTIKAKVNEKRQVAARARRYYDEYQLRMRSKMLKRRTREEQILKKLFDDGLEIQKQRVRELRKYAKEKTEAIEQQQTNQIQSLENYYKDQFSMLAENMTRERHDLKVRQEAQEKVMRQMRREMRKKMEKEIENLQETLTRDEDSAYFRQLEADRLRREFQLAMYKSDL